MAILRAKEVAKMSLKDRKDKLKELRLEIVKANVTANKANAKTKEIKRAISRLLTFMNQEKNKNKLSETTSKEVEELKSK